MRYEEKLLATNERVVFTTRQHWIVLAYHALINLGPAGVLAAGAIFFSMFFPPLLLALVVLLIPVVRFLIHLIRWWNEQYIITNRRVIQASGIINKNVIDSSLEKVNDVVLTQSVWGRLLGYGDVEILTASEIGVNKLRRIGGPVEFKTAMLDQKESMGVVERIDESQLSAPTLPADIPQLIAQLDELRKQGIITQEEFEQKKKILLDKI
jgi:uncharacterized membrane protein YdbT with pleckstrin-like domain